MNEIRKEIMNHLFNEFVEIYKQGENIGKRIGITTAIQIIRKILDN